MEPQTTKAGITPIAAGELERDAYGEWGMHQAECRKGCASADMEHDKGYCDEGWKLLTFWRVAMHVCEYGAPLENDEQSAIDEYLEETGLSIEDLKEDVEK